MYITSLWFYFVSLIMISFVNLDYKVTTEDLSKSYNFFGISSISTFDSLPYMSYSNSNLTGSSTEIVLENLEMANTMLFATLVECLVLTLGFILCLTYLVLIQTQNILMNSTTNLRFSKFAKI